MAIKRKQTNFKWNTTDAGEMAKQFFKLTVKCKLFSHFFPSLHLNLDHNIWPHRFSLLILDFERIKYDEREYFILNLLQHSYFFLSLTYTHTHSHTFSHWPKFHRNNDNCVHFPRNRKCSNINYVILWLFPPPTTTDSFLDAENGSSDLNDVRPIYTRFIFMK